MADVDIKYNNQTIASMNDSGTKTLTTEGKYCTDDITVEYTKPQGEGGEITPTGNLHLTASTTTQTDINVANYATVSVAPTPTESKSVTLGSSAPSTVYPASGSGKHLSSVSFTIDNSVIKPSNIAVGTTILGVPGTHTGTGRFGNVVTTSSASGSGYGYSVSFNVDTTNLIGFQYICTASVEQTNLEVSYAYLIGLMYSVSTSSHSIMLGKYTDGYLSAGGAFVNDSGLASQYIDVTITGNLVMITTREPMRLITGVGTSNHKLIPIY